MPELVPGPVSSTKGYKTHRAAWLAAMPAQVSSAAGAVREGDPLKRPTLWISVPSDGPCDSGALSRLVNRVVESLDDPSFFETATGIKQEPYPGDGTVPPHRIAWLEIHESRHASPKAQTVLSPKRPVASSGIGGNTTLLFHDED